MNSNPFGRVRRLIVGTIDDPFVPELHPGITPTIPEKYLDFFKNNSGRRFPSEYVERAGKEIENFASVLKKMGIVIDRPEATDFSCPIITPHWTTTHGNYAAMPRDLILVVKDNIIIAPMSWRCRFNEIDAYDSLLKKYQTMGLNVIFPPARELKDDAYIVGPTDNHRFSPILTEKEILFDAADFIVFDDVIIAQESLVTNRAGIRWLAKTLKDDFEVHTMAFDCPHPMHLDDTLLPLREGLFLANPEWVDLEKTKQALPKKLQSWKIIFAPAPIIHPDDPPKYFTSDWLSMNVFCPNPDTVVVEESQTPLVKLLEHHKFNVIPLPFKNYQCFSGSFHCATVEIERDEK